MQDIHQVLFQISKMWTDASYHLCNTSDSKHVYSQHLRHKFDASGQFTLSARLVLEKQSWSFWHLSFRVSRIFFISMSGHPLMVFRSSQPALKCLPHIHYHCRTCERLQLRHWLKIESGDRFLKFRIFSGFTCRLFYSSWRGRQAEVFVERDIQSECFS